MKRKASSSPSANGCRRSYHRRTSNGANDPSHIMSTPTIERFSGSGMDGKQDGASKAATFVWPASIAFHSTSRRLLVCDWNAHSVRAVSIDNGSVSTLFDNTSAGVINPLDFGPAGICCDPVRRRFFYFTDSRGQCIWKATFVYTRSKTPPPSNENGAGNDATSSTPNAALTSDPSPQHQPTSQPPETVIEAVTLEKLAGPLSPETGHRDGIGPDVRFDSPMGLVIDSVGQFCYVSDFLSCTIRKVHIQSRTVTTLCGSPNRFGFEDGVGARAQFGGPSALAISADNDRLFVAAFSAIRVVEIATGRVTTACGSDSCDFVNGVGQEARFDHPEGMYCDATGRVFICDAGNHVVRAIQTNADGKDFVVETLIGRPRMSGSTNGGVNDGALTYPRGICCDDRGNLYVADTSNRQIRVVRGSGAVPTIDSLMFFNASRVLRLSRLILASKQDIGVRQRSVLMCVLMTVANCSGLDAALVPKVAQYAEDRLLLSKTSRQQFEYVLTFCDDSREVEVVNDNATTVIKITAKTIAAQCEKNNHINTNTANADNRSDIINHHHNNTNNNTGNRGNRVENDFRNVWSNHIDHFRVD